MATHTSPPGRDGAATTSRGTADRRAPARPSRTVPARIVAVTDSGRTTRRDTLATEEPLEIRVGANGQRHSLAVTMRTPGEDFELAAGFLLSEGVVRQRRDIATIRYCANPQSYNIVTVDLAPSVPFDPQRFTRNVYTTSSCGVCGKTSLELVRANLPAERPAPVTVPDQVLLSLPATLQRQQPVFARTGGLHAAALFDLRGQLIAVREDVGRHNAMDKITGQLLLQDRIPATTSIILVSGRASFELVQKALTAGIPALAAVGAPSSLAVDLAREFGMQLYAFLRDGRFNVYAEPKQA